MKKILITGACGQLGTELISEMSERYGSEKIIATDVREAPKALADVHFEQLDVLDEDALRSIITRHEIGQIYHLAALLSATAEKNISLARKLNIGSLHHVLNAARDLELERVFWPSSIAVFGPDAPSKNTPQNTALNPTTVYGITKLTGEQWCNYYYNQFGVDVRSLRYPGLIGYKSLPGGGTTDYAVDIFHKALKDESYESFLAENCSLPMMYMHDAVKATLDLMEAPAESLNIRTSYNVAAVSFTPAEIAASIQYHLPDFEITYNPDYRQKIADSWPDSIDDSVARRDWKWRHIFSLDEMVIDIIRNLPDHFDGLKKHSF